MAFKKLKLWFDKELAILLANKIVAVKPQFDITGFVNRVEAETDDLELKSRVEKIADLFHAFLSEDYKNNISILVEILGPENQEETGMFTNFYWIMPIAKYVEKYGLEHFGVSTSAIKEITKRNTGEYAIRPFIEQDVDKTLALMILWSTHENKHVRRLSCEGLRPRLPWATKLQIFIDDPRPILPILNSLKDDSSKYVQKSVANCINDILKDNLDVGKGIINSWVENATKERKWIIKYALRNLLKKNNEWAMGVIIALG